MDEGRDGRRDGSNEAVAFYGGLQTLLGCLENDDRETTESLSIDTNIAALVVAVATRIAPWWSCHSHSALVVLPLA